MGICVGGAQRQEVESHHQLCVIIPVTGVLVDCPTQQSLIFTILYLYLSVIIMKTQPGNLLLEYQREADTLHSFLIPPL